MSFSPIAIVGRACILPGALTPDAFSARLEAGHSLLTPAPAGRWRVSIKDALGDSPDQCWTEVGGYVPADAHHIDPDRLRCAPERLDGLDPLALWTVACAQDALRDASQASGRDLFDPRLTERTGAIWGNLSFPSESLSRQAERSFLDQLGPALAQHIPLDATRPEDRFMSGLPAMVCAEALGLGAAAFCLDAACASSLYAIWLASRELQLGRADTMIAGAVQRADSLFLHVGFCALQALSKQGRSRPFHPGADGLIPAEGAACVVLRRLDDAVRDGDRVLGVIRGVGLSNDGRGKGFLAPSSEGQRLAIEAAYRAAGLTPADVEYVECHATGTLLGDRTELESMAAVWPADRPLRIGSHKSNLGHAITAAGMAGLLKVLGALERGVIPPTIGLDDAAAVADPARFEVVRRATPWPAHDAPRRAAVSAFGFGGNNAHMIIEEFTGHAPVMAKPAPDPAAVAVVGLGVVAGSCVGRDAFARAVLHDAPATPHIEGVSVGLDGLRTPPADLERAQRMQLATLQAAQEAVAGLTLDPARTSALIGMGCDPQVARYGVRWRLPEWAARWRAAGLTVPDVWLDEARDAAVASLNAAAVIGAMPNIPANRLNMALGLNAPSFTISAEELSGLVALQVAVDALRAGEVDHVLVGAADVASGDPVHEAALRALMPADRTQSGDAACVMVLTLAQAAEARGERVVALLDDKQAGQGAALVALPAALGHAHAASGLLRVAATALAAHHRALPGGQVWLVDDARHVAEARVTSALSPGRGASVTVRAGRDAAPLIERPAAPLEAAGEASGKLALVFGGAGATYAGQGRALMAATPWAQARLAARGLVEQASAYEAPKTSAVEADVLRTAWLSLWHGVVALDGMGLEPDMMLGHSLGEVSALYVSGAWRGVDGMRHELLGSQLFAQDLAGRYDAVRRDWFASGARDEASAPGQVWASYLVRGEVGPGAELARRSVLAHVTAIHTAREWVLSGWPAACEALLGELPAGAYTWSALAYDAAIHCPEVCATRPAWRTLHHRAWHTPRCEVWSQRHARPHEPSDAAVARALEAQAETTADLPTLILAAYDAGARDFLVCGPSGQAARWIAEILVERPHRVVAMDDGGQDELGALEAALRGMQAAGRLGALKPELARVFWPEAASVEGGRRLALGFAGWDGVAVEAVGERLSAQRFEAPAVVEQAPAVEATPIQRAFEEEPVTLKIKLPPELAAPVETPVEAPAEAPARVSPQAFVMTPAPALGAALAQRALSVAAPPVSAVVAEAPVEDVSHETSHGVAPMGGVMAAYVEAQRQLGAAQRGLIEAQRGAYLETLAAQRRGVERLAQVAGQGASPAVLVAQAHEAPAVARDAGDRPMGPGGALDRAQLEYLSWGEVSRVFGPLFAAQDAHRVQTRMPTPPLLLCDRVLRIDAEPASMKTGTIVTETDVTADAWYIHEGYMSPGIMIESGQADLLLVSYLGIDLQHSGERSYRLLGCELTYHGHAPKVGETLRYEITIDGWAKHGEVILFFFHYDCTVNGELRLEVRGGQAGFFTVEELAESGGVLWSPEEHTPDPARRVDAPGRLTARRSFERAALDAFATGRPDVCFGEGFERAQAQVKPPRIPHGNRLLLDRVLALDVAGGPWGSGYLLAEADVSPDDWFFDGHFYNDPCMPGTLMFDVCTQAMAFYMAALGLTLDRDGWRFEPVTDAQYLMRCRGQVTPTSRRVTYELFVEEVWAGGEPTLWADLLVTVDGLKAFHCRRMGLRLVPGDVLEALVALPAPDQPFSARPAPGSLAASRAVSPLENGPSSPIAAYEADPTYASIAALALGKHSQAFGPAFGVFDGARRAAHMPGPPYLFMTRVAGVDQPCDLFNAGVTAQIGYKLPESAWYFEENIARVMPYGVFMEVALQPCGWLSTWVGSMMRSTRDMSYRNLDGKATLYHIPKPDEGELVTTTKLVKNAMSGGMILQTFEVSVALNGAPIYVLETVFGFFPPEALAQQVGLPATDEDRAWLVAPCAGFEVVELGRSGQLRMVDRVTGAWPAGGRFGQGKWRAVIDVSPSDWFFKAHFFRDPVQPGSLGVEALFQLLQWVAAERLGLGADARFESVALGVEHVWRYRGQVTPDHREVVLELDLERMEREEAGSVLVVGQGWLWVGGKRIYEVQGLAVRAL